MSSPTAPSALATLALGCAAVTAAAFLRFRHLSARENARQAKAACARQAEARAANANNKTQERRSVTVQVSQFTVAAARKTLAVRHMRVCFDLFACM
jgi:hypothetical protein